MALSRKMRRYRGWLAVLALAVVATAVFLVTRPSKDNVAATTYSTEQAAKGTLSVTVSGTGNLELADEREAWPDAAGTVASVDVEEGDKVKKGDVLYVLDGDDAEAATSKALIAYSEAKSGVLRAEAALDKAEAQLDSLEEKADLPDSTVTSADIKGAKADVASARAQLASAKSSRSNALGDYNDALDAEDDLEVESPITGVVWTVDVEKGDTVSTGSGASTSSSASGSGASSASGASATSGSSSGSTAPVVIVPNKPLVVTLGINEVDLPSLKVGQRATVEFDAIPDLSMTGKVTDIADEGTVSSGVVTFDVTVKLDVRNEQLRPGMSAAATIVTNVARDVLLVPNAAVKSDDDGDYVQVLQNGQPSRVDVTVGLSGDSQTEILSGLSEGAEVVTSSTSSGSESGNSDRPGGGFMMMGGGPGR